MSLFPDIQRLKDPPCIDGMVGCDGSSIFSRSLYPESTSRFLDASSSQASVPTSSTNSSTRSIDKKNDGALSEAKDALSTPSDRLAVYTVTVRNLGTKALRGIELRHGPLPIGATFDSLQSGRQCSFDASFVQCLLDLLPGEVAKFDIAYRAAGGFDCSVARSLLSVALEHGGLKVPSLLASVSCEMQGASDSRLATRDLEGTSAEVFSVGDDGAGDQRETTQVYKPYEGVMPQSGVQGQFFASILSDGMVQPVAPSMSGESGGGYLSSLALIGAILFTVTACALRMSFRRYSLQF